MAVITESVRESDWLKHEAAAAYSRETVTIASGQGALPSGAVLGRITASGKFALVTVAAADGSQNAAAILIHPVDATDADADGVAIARDAIVATQALTYGADVNTAPEIAAVHAALGGLNGPVLVREGA